jgi:hypothetical protein
MTSKKLGALLQAVPPATARVVPDNAPAAPAAKPQPAPRRPVSVPAASDEPEVPLQVLVPTRIREELGIMVAKERTSLRSLILRAVRSLGIEVTEEEIRGKRGRKKSMNS